MSEMQECFNPNEINSKASACNFSKLFWLNSEYIKALSVVELSDLLGLNDLDSMLGGDFKNDRITALFEEIKPRVNNLVDFKKGVGEVILTPMIGNENGVKFVESILDSNKSCDLKDSKLAPALYDKAMKEKLFSATHEALLVETLKDFSDSLFEIDSIKSVESGKDLIHNFSKNIESKFKEAGLKPSVFMQSLRFALLGQKGGIDLGAALFILGKTEVQFRTNKHLQIILKTWS